MTYAAQVAIAADRYTPCVRTITFRGLDLTGVALRMQARLRGDTPGSPLFDLQNVSNAQAQGLKLVSVYITDGYPVSVVQMRINETTIEGLPYSGELGDATSFEYDMQGTLGGDKRVLMHGSFTIGAGVTGADNAPLNRPFGYGTSAAASGMRSGAVLTFGETRIDITIDGADLVAPLMQRAIDAAESAEEDRAAADLAAATALAASRYYPTRAAGEAASATGQMFSTDDGAGNVIYYRRTAGGSVEIGRALTPTALAATGAAALIGFDGRSVMEKLRETVSVRDPRFAGGAKGDGVTDDTPPFQAVIDAYPNGVTILVPPGGYLLGRVNVTSRNITIRVDQAATIKRSGTPTVTDRSIFRIENLLNANFSFEGGTVDLNGEGPIGIGVAGRNPNRYRSQTVGGTIAMAGPNSELLYALRCSHIHVSRTVIKNSGETGILFRNCSDTTVEHSRFYNLGNAGVEVSLVAASDDGGSGAMPDCGRHYVRWCYFEDIDDFGLGTGNGCAVLVGGGNPAVPVTKTVEVSDCEFVRCQRDVHFEISTPGKYVDGVKLRGGRSQEPGQGSVGLVSARGSVEDWEVFNPGGAPTAALGPDYPDIYAVVVSGADTGRVNLSNIRAIQNLMSKITRGTTGTIMAGSTAFTSATAAFSGADVGRPIGIVGAGPQSSDPSIDPGYVAHITRISAVVSPTQATLARPAVTSVTNAVYAYGTAMREGIRLYAAVDVTLSNSKIEGGIASGLPNEPPAAAVNVVSCIGRVIVTGTSMIAPTTTGTTPAGLRLAGVMTGKLKYRNVDVTGFAGNYVGIDSYRSSCIGPSFASANGASIAPASTINADGPENAASPRGDYFTVISSLGFLPTLAGESLTVTIRAYRFDGLVNSITVTLAASGIARDLTAYEMWQINQDNAPIRYIGLQVRSNKANSTASVAYYLRADEG